VLPGGAEPFEVEWAHGTVRGLAFGEGPVVYLVHGWGGRGDQFATFVEPLVEAGYRAVLFDAPSHGGSDPGAFGPRSTTGVEFAKALDAVFARFGPADAVIAHSMGAIATMLALNYGWLGADRLVFVAPMCGFATVMDDFQALLGFGPRTRRRAEARVWRQVGLHPDSFELRHLWRQMPEPLPALVVQDTRDPQVSFDEVAEVAGVLGAEVVVTTGLGHNRVLHDTDTVGRVLEFLGSRVERTAPAMAEELSA
jgi:pimeloyl-ACP methyl ester carboxylesterase